MAKATELNSDMMTAAVPVPKAALLPAPPVEPKRSRPAPKPKVVPLQVISLL